MSHRLCGASMLLGLLLVVSAPVAAYAQEGEALSPAELVAIDRGQDGRVVTVSGEAIGEDLRADGDHRWVNVLGGGTAVGMWMTEKQASEISRYGRWGVRGDAVRVTGVLHIACEDHAGEFDVHADLVEVVQRGRDLSYSAEWWKAAVGVAGVGVFALLTRLYRWRKERRLG